MGGVEEEEGEGVGERARLAEFEVWSMRTPIPIPLGARAGVVGVVERTEEETGREEEEEEKDKIGSAGETGGEEEVRVILVILFVVRLLGTVLVVIKLLVRGEGGEVISSATSSPIDEREREVTRGDVMRLVGAEEDICIGAEVRVGGWRGVGVEVEERAG